MLRVMKCMILGLLVICTPALASEIAYMPVNHQRVVPATTVEVWRRLHDFLEDQGISVVREDVAAGTIDAQRSVLGNGSFAGMAECRSKLFWHPEREVTNLTVKIKPALDGARVTANAAFLQTAKTKKKGALSLDCTSNGVLERAVLDVASGQPMESAIVPH